MASGGKSQPRSEASASTKDVRPLTGLRGIAAVFVVVFHEAGNFGGHSPAHNLLRHGYNAVDLFFVLSGFVMAMTYGDDFSAGFRPGGYLRFLGKRIARVYPLYVVATLVTFAIFALHLSHLGPVGRPAWTLGCNLMMVQAWGLAESIVGPAWSISTEWGAYLLFPVLSALALSRPAWRSVGLSLLATLGLLALEFGPRALVLGEQTQRLGPLDLYGVGTIAPLVRCLAGFSLGLASYRYRRRIAAGWSVPLALASVAVLLLPGTDILFVLLCAALIPSLMWEKGLVAKVLGSGPVFTLGVWSYSIYILHARFNPVRAGAERLLTGRHVPAAPALAILASTSLVIVCAAVTYRFIEKPGRDALRKLFASPTSRPVRQEPSAP